MASLLFSLFITFCKIGLFTIGGGYAMLPFIQREVLAVHGWLSAAEIADIVAISQMTPGPIAINAATFTGMKVAGVAGACLSTLGVVLPSLVIASLVARALLAFQRSDVVKGVLMGMKPAVTGLIAAAALGILVQTLYLPAVLPASVSAFLASFAASVDWPAAALAAAAYAALSLGKKRVHPIATILACGAAGIALYYMGV